MPLLVDIFSISFNLMALIPPPCILLVKKTYSLFCDVSYMLVFASSIPVVSFNKLVFGLQFFSDSGSTLWQENLIGLLCTHTAAHQELDKILFFFVVLILVTGPFLYRLHRRVTK